jgi:hypothetical protein
MDIGKSFTYVFEDKKWIEKILIGGLLMLVPILGLLLLYGYGVQLVRNVRSHKPEPLPEWDDWGTKIVEGLKLVVVLFIWSLPLIVLGFLMSFPLALAGNSDSGSSIASLFSVCFSCFAFLYGLVIWLATPGIIIKFAETGELAEGFKFGDILDFTKKHLGQIIIVALVSWVVYMIAGLIGAVLCLVGLVFTMFWATLVQFHLVGQIGLEAAAPARPLESLPAEEPVEKLPAKGSEEAPAEDDNA